ncbi:hypothetical protein TNCV_2182801 [Trichonephila clavipes]|uniref:Uncharacterized protein n=1 Tax=Trichonephila clavipes TaxID=2585209 RepID=A0A8X6VV55_TRICX|nr:hypothetical protein TNCV_2182801 [Trichonephila clavipes]
MCIIYPMAVQAIKLGVRSLCRYRMQAGGLLGASRLPSEYCTQNRKSSEQTTLCHSCIRRFAHKSHHLSLCCISYRIMVAVLTAYAAVNVIAPYERILGVLQTWPFPH